MNQVHILYHIIFRRPQSLVKIPLLIGHVPTLYLSSQGAHFADSIYHHLKEELPGIKRGVDLWSGETMPINERTDPKHGIVHIIAYIEDALGNHINVFFTWIAKDTTRIIHSVYCE